MTGIDTSIPSESLNKAEAAMLRHFRACHTEAQQLFIGMAEDMAIKFPSRSKTQLRLVSSGSKQGKSTHRTRKVRATRTNLNGAAHLRLVHERG